MEIRVHRVMQGELSKWLVEAPDLDDLEFHLFRHLVEKPERDQFTTHNSLDWEKLNAAMELARRLGHKLILCDCPEGHVVENRPDRLGWTDFRHGKPKY